MGACVCTPPVAGVLFPGGIRIFLYICQSVFLKEVKEPSKLSINTTTLKGNRKNCGSQPKPQDSNAVCYP